jgi:hypothetical protein
MALRKTAATLSLIVLTMCSGLAHAAEPLTLSCQSGEQNYGPNAWTQTVNFSVSPDTQAVELSEPAGAVLAATSGGNLGGLAATVQIGPSVISWRRSNSVGGHFRGHDQSRDRRGKGDVERPDEKWLPCDLVLERPLPPRVREVLNGAGRAAGPSLPRFC